MNREKSLQSFPKEERLLCRSAFIEISAKGHRVSGRHFIVIRVPNAGTVSRIGITASRKVGCAVVRNRIKRLVRECYRLNKCWFPAADYSIIARKSAVHLNLLGICSDLRQALKQFKADHG